MHGGRLREMHGPGLKRAIKYDDKCQSLAMDIRLPGEDVWTRLGAADMVALDKKQQENNSAMRKAGQRGEEGDRMRKILMVSHEESSECPVEVSEDDEGENLA